MQRIRDYKIHLLYYIAQYLQPIVSKSWKHLFLPIIYPLSTWYNYLAIGILHLPAQSSELFCKDKHAVGDGKGVCTTQEHTWWCPAQLWTRAGVSSGGNGKIPQAHSLMEAQKKNLSTWSSNKFWYLSISMSWHYIKLELKRKKKRFVKFNFDAWIVLGMVSLSWGFADRVYLTNELQF